MTPTSNLEPVALQLAPAPADVAHDIRNVLTPLLNAARIIRLAAGEDTRVDAALGIIDRQAVRLTRLAEGPARLDRPFAEGEPGTGG